MNKFLDFLGALVILIGMATTITFLIMGIGFAILLQKVLIPCEVKYNSTCHWKAVPVLMKEIHEEN